MKEIYSGPRMGVGVLVITYVDVNPEINKRNVLGYASYALNQMDPESLSQEHIYELDTNEFYLEDTAYYLHNAIYVLQGVCGLLRCQNDYVISRISRMGSMPEVIQVGTFDIVSSPILMRFNWFYANTKTNMSSYIGQEHPVYNQRELVNKLATLEQYDHRPHMCIGIGTNTKGEAGRLCEEINRRFNSNYNPNFKIGIFNNMADAINETTYYWIESLGGGYGNKYCGVAYPYNPMYAIYLNNVLILSDSRNGLKYVTTLLKDKLAIQDAYNIIVLNQYHIGKAIIRFDNTRSAMFNRVLSMGLINKNKIIKVMDKDQGEGFRHCRGLVTYQVNPKIPPIKLELIVTKLDREEYNTAIDYWLIPYTDDGQYAIESIKLLNDIIGCDWTQRDNFRIPFVKYLWEVLMSINNNDLDPLSIWFNMCVNEAANNKNNLMKAYERLRDELLLEYHDVKIYLDNNDFSKKKPVPSVTIDEHFKTNINKTFGFDTQEQTYNTLNGKSLLTPIKTRYTVMKYWLPLKKSIGKSLVGCVDIMSLYQSNMNNIDITFDKITDAYNNSLKGVFR